LAALSQQPTTEPVDTQFDGAGLSAAGGNRDAHVSDGLKEAARLTLRPVSITDPVKERIEGSTDPRELAALLSEHRDDPKLASLVAERIYKFGDSRCENALVDYLQRHGADEEHRATVQKCVDVVHFLALERDIDPRSIERALKPLMGSKDPELRKNALIILGEVGHPEALRELHRIRTDRAEDPALRLHALVLSPEGQQRILERMLEEKLSPDIEASILWGLYGREGKYRDTAVHRLNDEKTDPKLRGMLLSGAIGRPGIVDDKMIADACASSEVQLSVAGTLAAQLRAGENGPAVLRQAIAASESKSSYSEGALLGVLAPFGAVEDRARFEKILNAEDAGTARDAAFRYFAKVDPAFAVEVARLDYGDGPNKCLSSGAIEVLLANGDKSDDQAIIESLQKISPYSDLDRVLEAVERYKRVDLLTHIPAPADPNERYGYKKIVRALVRSGDEDAVSELMSTPCERFQRGNDAVALAKSPAIGALEATYTALSKGDSPSQRALAHEFGSHPVEYTRFISNLAASGEPKLTAWADDLIRAKTLGIEYPLRFRPQDLHHIIETRRSDAPATEGEPQALVVLPRSDHNRAFYGVAQVIESLRERGYRVVLHEASNEDDVAAALRSQNRYGPSDFIILGAHGTKEMMSFGGADPARGIIDDERLALDLSDRAQFKNDEIRGALKEGGHVMLLSCSTGEGGERAKNMANMMREIFPHAAEDGISAPPIPVRAGSPLEFDKDGKPVQLKEPWIRFYLIEAEVTARTSGVPA